MGTLLDGQTPDVGGVWDVQVNPSGLDVQNGSVDTVGAGREAYASLTRPLVAGEILQLDFTTADTAGSMFAIDFFPGIELYSSNTYRMQIGAPGTIDNWGVQVFGDFTDEYGTVHQVETITASFTYAYDTGAYTFQISGVGSALTGTITSNYAIDQFKFLNGGGTDINIDSIVI